MDEFEKELATLLNFHSIDTKCHTPDFILAKFVVKTLEVQKQVVEANAVHQGWKLDGEE